MTKKINELRLRKGRLDDIVLSGGDLHLEDMTGKMWWLGFTKGKKRVSFYIRSKTKIEVTIQDMEYIPEIVEQEK